MRMQKAAENNIATEAVDGNDAYQSIVSDLMCLIGQVQASLSRIESAIACETSLASAEAADADTLSCLMTSRPAMPEQGRR
jgi:hypothetical protein